MPADSAPSISVLIHNHNRADCLAKCLDSIALQDARPLEIVVLDAGSEDDSLDILARKSMELNAADIQVIVRNCQPTGVPASRNLAASIAHGEILFFLDNDATLERPDTLSRVQGEFAGDETLGLCACRVLAGDRDQEDPFCWVYRRPVDPWLHRAFDTFTFAGAGFAVRATAYQASGGFWEVIQYSREEELLALRLLDGQWKVAYRPEIAVRHYPDPRGRRSLIERRAVELKNGALIYWYAYPSGFGYLISLLRLGSMTLRAGLRREGALSVLWGGWRDAGHLWREFDLFSEPVSWTTVWRVIRLHVSKGDGHANDP